uniref:Transcription initiation factor TFIID subunit 9 n=1 Tax=Hyaloperonospora arabidopsidis (strain Emoy2) TaxID=559515 RepID=M4BAG5_HYAAE
MGSDNRRLHEDEDDGNEREEGVNVQPLDVLCMEQVLESMGADKFEPRVVAQLLEFVHRYVTEILVDAQEYSMFADKQTIDPDDIRLAIASRLNHHYAQVPPRELMMELADKRNAIPLPSISNEYGVRLPPLQYQLVTKESDRQDPLSHKVPNTPRVGDATGPGAGIPNAARPPVHLQVEGSRNKKFARSPLSINFHTKK